MRDPIRGREIVGIPAYSSPPSSHRAIHQPRRNDASTMPPPPATPSPHRFVIKKQPPPPRSQLAHESTSRPGATQQFNATPRFTLSSTPRPTATQNVSSSTPAVARYVTPARPRLKSYESIEDPSEDPSDDLPDGVYGSIEQDEPHTDVELSEVDTDDGYEIDTRAPKRRRISPSPISPEYGTNEDEVTNENIASSPIPILSSPIARYTLPPSTSKPKFLLSTPLPASTSTPQPSNPIAHPFHKPPRFRPPDPDEQSHSTTDPLPEQFSPHRKGQKYIPGGLAAEVRDWLMNLDSALPAHAGRGKVKEEVWLVRVRVEEVTGGGRAGMSLVRGRQVGRESGSGSGSEGLTKVVDGLERVKVILAGEGAGVGLQRGKRVEVGKVVGIKGPVWEVVVEGEKWGVGVDWKVLE
ncbi:hypothetical protein CJF31_00004479 [Rutstroemia sp. NJR-2017a BVV2]|nr:hypothetical protein CJF31_00004479 [Rutstroemia sp. NJR-2017a BVV2]